MEFVHPKALRTFAVLAEELHFGRAAQRLGVSQSTVSEQLRSMEDDLGVVLFERHSRGVTLSEAGRQLLEPARRLVDDHERLLQLARSAAQEQPQVTLGALAGAMPLVARLAEAAAAAGISLELRTVTWPEGVRAVANGELTAMLGVLIDAVPTPALSSIRLTQSQTVVVMVPNHPLAATDVVAHDALHGRRLLVPVGYVAALERQFGSLVRGAEIQEIPSVLHATGDLLAGRSLALSVHWLHRWWRGFGLVDRPLDPAMELSIGLVYRSASSPAAVERMERLAELVRPMLPSA